MRRLLATMICVAAAAAPARAAEFVPGMEAYGAWEANVFHTSQNEESAFSTLAGPVLELRERQGSLLYDLKYTMHYEAFPSISGINDFQHFVDANGSYRFRNGRTYLTFRNYFSLASSAVQIFNSQLPVTAGLVQVNPTGRQVGREDLLYNDSGVTLTHSLTPLWQLQFAFDYTLSEFPQNKQLAVDQFNSTSLVGSVNLTRQITPRLSAGFGSSVTRQDFEQQNVSGRGTSIYQAFGLVTYQITPTLSLQASAGPAIDDPDQLNTPNQSVITFRFPTSNGELVDASTCPFQGSFRVFDPVNPQRCQQIPGSSPVANATRNQFNQVSFVGANEVSSPGSTLTYYGHLTLTKRWETLTAIVGYDRGASTASGLGTSTNVDSLNGSLVWLPTSMWSVTLTGLYSRQTAASKTQQPLLAVLPTTICTGIVIGNQCFLGTAFPNVAETVGVTSRLVNNGFEFDTYRVGLNVSRKLTKHLTLVGIADWWRQENKGSNVESTSTSDMRFQLGFTYTFDPIPLWTKDL